MGTSCVNIKTKDDDNDVAGLEMHICLESQVCFFIFYLLLFTLLMIVYRRQPLNAQATTLMHLVLLKSSLVQFFEDFHEPGTGPMVWFRQMSEPWTGP